MLRVTFLLQFELLKSNLGLTILINLSFHLTGVRIIGHVGIGEVQMTTFFYGTKSLLKMSFRVDGFF